MTALPSRLTFCREITSRALDPVEPYLAESMQVAYDGCKRESGGYLISVISRPLTSTILIKHYR